MDGGPGLTLGHVARFKGGADEDAALGPSVGFSWPWEGPSAAPVGAGRAGPVVILFAAGAGAFPIGVG